MLYSFPSFHAIEHDIEEPGVDEYDFSLSLAASHALNNACPTLYFETSVVDFNPGVSETQTNVPINFSLPLSWRGLSFEVNGRPILHSLTGTALCGRCLAIMGPSGAGKTTFLNAISDRLASGERAKMSGNCQLGDAKYKHAFRRALGFVTQDDIVSFTTTPYEALYFSLRTRRGASRAETHARVMETLATLRLLHCKDTMVGFPGSKAGLSGGERKRTCIGVELICDPKVLLLDEPTSGLDSVTAAKIIQLLQELARLGRTIIYTIHQPTAEVLSFFDDVMLLAKGQCVYHGSMQKSLDYFASIGFCCPQKYTAADYFIMLLQDVETSSTLIERWKSYLRHNLRTPHNTSVRVIPDRKRPVAGCFLESYVQKFRSSTLIQLSEVFLRQLRELWRDRMFLSALSVQALYFSIIAGLIFAHLGNDTASIQDREGLFYAIIANRFMGSIYAVLSFYHKGHVIYLCEQHAAAYSPLIYFLGTISAQLPIMASLCVLESVIIYSLTGLYASASAFFTYLAVMVLFQDVCTGIGVFIASCFESLTLATTMVALINLPLTFANGLFASTQRLRPYYYPFEKLSYIRHAYILLARNELRHINHIDCDIPKYGEVFCRNQPQNGNEVLVQLGFDPDPQSTNVCMWMSLVCIWVLVRIFAVGALIRLAHSKR